MPTKQQKIRQKFALRAMKDPELAEKSEIKDFFTFFGGYIRKEVEWSKGLAAGPILYSLANKKLPSDVRLAVGKKLIYWGGNSAVEWEYETEVTKESVKSRAKENGCYAFLEELNLVAMKGSTKGRVIEERLKLSSKKAMATNFLNANNCFNPSSEGYSMMKRMETSIIECLKQKTPLSEDMLYVTWKWVSKVTGEARSGNSELWTTIKETLLSVLTIPINKRDWEWFKVYVMENVV